MNATSAPPMEGPAGSGAASGANTTRKAIQQNHGIT